METEIFKDIPGYEGHYQASNLGNIYSIKFKIFKLRYHICDGYYYIFLCLNGNKRIFRVNRLVASAFLGLDINNKKILVCHKDDDKLNNNVNNLFLGTHSDNMQDCIKKGRHHMQGKLGKLSKYSIKVNQFDLQGNFIKTWDSGRDITRELGINCGNISRCCLGKRSTAGKFIWKH